MRSKSLLLPFVGVFLVVGVCVFLRHPTTNYVFDEQEALLANPYVQGGVDFHRVFHVDFWGREPAKTIGSYRPLPNLIWRSLAFTLRSGTPFFLHLVNVLLHALVAALAAFVLFRVTDDRRAAWASGITWAVLGVTTEVVSGVVGLADLLAATCALTGLLALRERAAFALPGVFAATLLGLFAKETMLAFVPLGCLFAAYFGPIDARRLRAAWVLVAQIGAFVAYVGVRRSAFPVKNTLVDATFSGVPALGPVFSAFLGWFRHPSLPIDPINNPLVGAPLVDRCATAASVFARGLGQLVLPARLSADYSFAEETVVHFGLPSVIGVFVVVLLSVVGAVLLARSNTPPARRFLGFSWIWLVVGYLPVANVFVLLPTIRADRLWYFPALGFAWTVGLAFSRAVRVAALRRAVAFTFALFLGLQACAARSHAFDYEDDLVFWRRTVQSAPRSAKARLNLGVMLGARRRMDERIAWTRSALELAPDWPMGNVYLGDALCRTDRLDEAWKSYEKGLRLGPQHGSLVALALQCLWERGAYAAHRAELAELARAAPSTWLSYLVNELEVRGEAEGGVPREHRPRGYNQKSQ